MDLSDDLPPMRRPLFFPVVIATTFLSIIGMSVGLLLGNHRDDEQAAGPVDNVSTETPQPADEPSPAGPACREETQEAAGNAGAQGTVTEVLKLMTATSEIYICTDLNGNLYYHANNGRSEEWIENFSSLFLAGVREDGDGYTATAKDGTVFTVNSERLVIKHSKGGTETQPATG